MGATGTTGNKLIYLTRCILVLLHTHKTPLFLGGKQQQLGSPNLQDIFIGG